MQGVYQSETSKKPAPETVQSTAQVDETLPTVSSCHSYQKLSAPVLKVADNQRIACVREEPPKFIFSMYKPAIMKEI